MTKHTIKITLSHLLVAVLCTSIGWYAHHWRKVAPEKRERQGGFQFISPLLDVELPEGYDVRHEPIPFKYKLSKFVDAQIKSGNVLDMSVYYRDLSDGPWFGINEKVNYNPGSIMKVPLMVAWLKRAEKDPSVLRRKLVYDEQKFEQHPQGLPVGQTLQSGQSYTVEELLRYMIRYSDNRATQVLSAAMPNDELMDVIVNMDVAREPDMEPNKVTVHGYSGFLRILFNASFLNRDMSEKALEMMSHAEFRAGIIAGIPQGTRVASKFGEFWTPENAPVLQLHEYAIVYHPNGPYILGVMTRGTSEERQADVIKAVSELVYASVNRQIGH